MLKIARDEWRWLLGWSFFTLFLTSVPLILGLFVTPAGHEFTGLLFNAHDGNSYLSKMQEGRRGDWLYHSAFTSEPAGPGAVLFIYYLLLGKIAGLLSLPNILVFHAVRLLTGLLLLVVSYGFIGLLFNEKRAGRLAFLLVCFSAGLGWLLAPLGILPVDFWVAEGYTFLSIFANAHFPLTSACLVLALAGGLAGMQGKGFRYYLWAALAAGVIGFVLPYVLVTLAGVLALFWLRQVLARSAGWRVLPGLAVIGLGALPGPLLTLWTISRDTTLQAFMRQGRIPTPDVFSMLAGYGLLVPFTLAGLWWAEKLLPGHASKTITGQPSLDPVPWRLVSAWLLATVILLVLPFNFSRRLVEGVHLPLACLAAAGWYEIVAPRLASRWRRPLRQLLVGGSALTSLVLVLLSVSFLFPAGPDLNEPVKAPYLTPAEQGAISWLNAHARPGEVVLSGPLLGNVLPGRTLVKTFYGHLDETIDPDRKYALLEQFFNKNTAPIDRYGIINSWSLKYLVYGWREKQLGLFDPAQGNWQKVFQQDDLQIFRLTTS
jgi:hypothetical protein